MKVIDCFTFCNDLEILFCRLEILWKYVDYFLLVEASTYFSGKPKPYFFDENKHYFHKYIDKIIHVKIDDMPTNEDVSQYLGTNPGFPLESNFDAMRELYQTETGFRRGIQRIDLNHDDLFIVSDTDEIPDPSSILRAFEMSENINKPIYMDMDWFYSDVNFFRDDGPRKWWRGTFFQRWKNIKNTYMWFIKSRNARFDDYSNADNVMGREIGDISANKNTGCHFSYFGNRKKIIEKMHNFGHANEKMSKNFATDRQVEQFQYRDLKFNELTEEHLQHFFDVATKKVIEIERNSLPDVYFQVEQLYEEYNYK